MVAANDVTQLERVSSWGEFTACLRALHESCGRPKYDALSASSGLSKSAISNLIGKNPLRRPSEPATLRFVAACLQSAGADESAVRRQTEQWSRVWLRLRVTDSGGAPTDPISADDAVPGTPPPDGPRRSWRRVAAFGGVLAGLVVGGTAVAVLSGDPESKTPAGASPSGAQCSADDAAPADGRLGRAWDGVSLCPNEDSPVYAWANLDDEPVGRLRSNPSWFVCWTRGATVEGSEVWYYTQGDDLLAQEHLDAWGFVPAMSVGGSVHPDPGVTRECPFATGPAESAKP